ncbi:hypothetical protein ColLi_00246 [Colletotrichum liriopes]|uniref:Uncharacterized protein n=1 Tax=Colletotrichum liriopes TaxID=708192 RepID=A0AA37GBL3_9PEZI|nr:hypothetical protein ColLi_00246 [Colletotrichum liriopes]
MEAGHLNHDGSIEHDQEEPRNESDTLLDSQGPSDALQPSNKRLLLYTLPALLLCSLSYRLWQVAMARVVVGTGTSGIELLVVIVINGQELRACA